MFKNNFTAIQIGDQWLLTIKPSCYKLVQGFRVTCLFLSPRRRSELEGIQLMTGVFCAKQWLLNDLQYYAWL